jgi:hypothetical protein
LEIQKYSASSAARSDCTTQQHHSDTTLANQQFSAHTLAMSSMRRLSQPKVVIETEGPPKGSWDPPDASAKVHTNQKWPAVRAFLDF